MIHEEEILEAIRPDEEVSISDLEKRLPRVDRLGLREKVWDMIDLKRLTLTSAWKLKLPQDIAPRSAK